MADKMINEIGNTAASINNTDNVALQTASNVSKKCTVKIFSDGVIEDMVAQTNTFGTVQKYDATAHGEIAADYDIPTAKWVLDTGTALGYVHTIAGFAMSNNATFPNTHLDVGAGIASTSTMIRYAKTTSSMTKRIDQTWLVGTNNGGMASGVALTADTWYHFHAILNDTTLAVDFVYDTSLTCSHIPAGYQSYARIGSVKTDSSSHIKTFLFTEINGVRRFEWKAPAMEVFAVSFTDEYASYAMGVPAGLKVEAVVNLCLVYSGVAGISVYLSDPDLPVMTASYLNSPLATIQAKTSNYVGSKVNVITNTSSEIRINVQSDSAESGSISVVTLGWNDSGNKYFS